MGGGCSRTGRIQAVPQALEFVHFFLRGSYRTFGKAGVPFSKAGKSTIQKGAAVRGNDALAVDAKLVVLAETTLPTATVRPALFPLAIGDADGDAIAVLAGQPIGAQAAISAAAVASALFAVALRFTTAGTWVGELATWVASHSATSVPGADDPAAAGCPAGLDNHEGTRTQHRRVSIAASCLGDVSAVPCRNAHSLLADGVCRA